jgi:diguanylate cyclase (GGDEF)-like protein
VKKLTGIVSMILIVIFLFLTVFLFFRYLKKDLFQNLFELEAVFNDDLDFCNLSKNVLTSIITKTQSNAGMIYWLDEIQNEFKLKTLHGALCDNINILTRIIKQSDGLLQRIQNRSEGIIWNNLKINLDLKKIPEIAELSKCFQSIMAVPLLTTNEHMLGLLIVLREKGTYQKKQLKLLNYFAPRMTVRLDNVRLYQLTRETALENARLYVNISKLYHQATLDELTGLYNRNFLMQRIKEEIKKSARFKQPLSLIFADIDLFKLVNDQYGHQVGDQLLAEFGELLRKSLREYDVPCRFGGEEFVILLPATSLENASELAERLRARIAENLFCANHKPLQITSSFGVSAMPELNGVPNNLLDDENLNIYVENLVARADGALYQAKDSGRNQVVSQQSS